MNNARHVDIVGRKCSNREIEIISKPNVQVADVLFVDLEIAPRT
jgi:hypothetical protein